MFPFKTDKLEVKGNYTDAEIQQILIGFISREKLFEIKSSNQLYGRVKSGNAIYTLGNSPQRNSFIPVAVLRWKTDGKHTNIVSFLRLDLRIIVGIVAILTSSFIISFESKNLFPAIVLAIILFILILIFWLSYEKSKKLIQERNEEILKRIGNVSGRYV